MTNSTSRPGQSSSRLDPNSTRPLHEQIAAHFEAEIVSGELNDSQRLPSHRHIANDFGVAIGTVTRAFELLISRGLVRAEVGRGSFVSRRSPVVATIPGLLDLSRNVPPPTTGSEALKRLSAAAIDRHFEQDGNGYNDPAGSLRDRRAYCEWLGRLGIPLDPGQMLLTTNAQHAIDLATSDIAKSTKRIAVDTATYPGAIAAARLRGLSLVPVESDSEGTLPDALERAICDEGVGAYYAIPTAHSPLATHMTLARRLAISKVCVAKGIQVIEDDACAALRVPGIPALKTLMPNNVYYIVSTSKCFSPFLTSGASAPPSGRYSAVLENLAATVWSAAPLTSGIMALIFEEKTDIQLNRQMRESTQQRQELAQRVLGLPGTPGVLTFHVWLPMELSAAERLARRCLERGVRVTPPTATSTAADLPAGVRLCLGGPQSLQELERGLESIAPFLTQSSEHVI